MKTGFTYYFHSKLAAIGRIDVFIIFLFFIYVLVTFEALCSLPHIYLFEQSLSFQLEYFLFLLLAELDSEPFSSKNDFLMGLFLEGRLRLLHLSIFSEVQFVLELGEYSLICCAKEIKLA